MGSMTVNPVTPLLAGATVTKTDTGGSTSTIVIAATTAQSVLDFSKLLIRFENYSSTASFTVTLNVGDDFSEVGQGANAAITIATASTAGYVKVIGGTSFESARFQDTDNYAEFTITTAATAYVTAFMLPSP
jgi:hypothetical protein